MQPNLPLFCCWRLDIEPDIRSLGYSKAIAICLRKFDASLERRAQAHTVVLLAEVERGLLFLVWTALVEEDGLECCGQNFES